MRSICFAASVIALSAATACGDVAAVHVSTLPLCRFTVGDSAYATANADRSKFPVTAYTSATRPDAFTWVSSDPEVISVSQRGLFHAISVGTATVTASAEGLSGSANIHVVPIAQTAAITPSSVVLGLNDTVLVTAKAWDSTGVPMSLVRGQTLFSVLDFRVAQVWESLPNGARIIAFERGTTALSWRAGERCGVLSVVVR